MYNYPVFNNLFWIFLIQMKFRLQIMYNHMVGRAASIVSPWSILYSLVKTYFSLLFSYLAVLRFNLTSALEEEREYQSVNQLQFIHYFTVRYIFLRIISGSPSSFFKSNVLITIIVAFVLSRILWIDYTIQENV